MKISTLLGAGLLSRASATIYYAGVAESSGEFGVWSQTSTPGTGLPGKFGVEYSFISKPAIDIYVDKNKVRKETDVLRKRGLLTEMSRSTCSELHFCSSACAHCQRDSAANSTRLILATLRRRSTTSPRPRALVSFATERP